MLVPQDKIVVLCHSDNGILKALSIEDALAKFKGEFEYDKEASTWTWPKGDQGHRGPFEIGRDRYIREGHRYGVIGLYRSDDLKSINSMLYAARSATRETVYEGPFSE